MSADKVSLRLDALKSQEHLILSALRFMGKKAVASADELVAAIDENSATTVDWLDDEIGIPGFVHKLDAATVEAVLLRFEAGGWASHFVSKGTRMFNLTPAVERAIAGSRALQTMQKPTEASLQQTIVGTMVQLHRATGDSLDQKPLRYLYFHHLSCSVPFPASLLSSKLQEWASKATIIGPFPVKLRATATDTTMVTARVEMVELSDSGKFVFRLNLQTAAN